MFTIKNDSSSQPTEDGMACIEAEAVLVPKSGEGPTHHVKMRLDFAEGNGAIALGVLREMALPKNLHDAMFEMALRGDESARAYVADTYEHNTGERRTWEELLEEMKRDGVIEERQTEAPEAQEGK